MWVCVCLPSVQLPVYLLALTAVDRSLSGQLMNILPLSCSLPWAFVPKGREMVSLVHDGNFRPVTGAYPESTPCCSESSSES